MYRKIPFIKKELDVIDEIQMSMGRTTYVRNTPVTARQNIETMFFEKRPFWMPAPSELSTMMTSLYNLQLGRGSQADITDAFGIRWQYVASAGGSIVHPGAPMMENVNEWREKVIFPDIDAWDWAGAAADSRIDPRLACETSFLNGFWFERLISFMDFIPAAMALIDDEQSKALHELFEATTDFACHLVDKFCEYWPMMDSFNVHDDWGSQKAPFFSNEVAYDLFVPNMKKLTDNIHSKGRIATLHSCGHNVDRIQCYIDGGFDQWGPQTMNDIKYLYDNFGDKIVLAIFPDRTDLAAVSEAEQRAAARELVDRFSQPGKPAMLGVEASKRSTPAFLEEVYEYSRKVYLAQN